MSRHAGQPGSCIAEPQGGAGRPNRLPQMRIIRCGRAVVATKLSRSQNMPISKKERRCIGINGGAKTRNYNRACRRDLPGTVPRMCVPCEDWDGFWHELHCYDVTKGTIEHVKETSIGTWFRTEI